uniref:Uncharacterized protein n=1 Tax=Schistosoma haematobium TaxID=6185 RepID=A0A095C4N2_SCHHA
MQICSSKFNEVEENIQSISSYEGSNLPRNVPDIDHSQSKISVIQSHNEESLIQVQPPTAKINQKSLADELFEMEADHSILLRYGIRNSFTFENKTVEESLRDLTLINRSTLETRSSSTHAVFFSGRFGKKGRDTRNGTVKHEKKGVDDWSLVPVITERSQLTKTNYLIANQENETLVNNKLLKSFPASIEQLTDILEADHKTLLCGINMGQLKKTHIEISLTREVLKLGKISAGYLRQLLKYLETQIYLFIQELLQYRDPKPMGRHNLFHLQMFIVTKNSKIEFFDNVYV